MSESFIGQRIEVRSSGIPAQPTQFRWDGRDYAIEAILHQWTDWGFSPVAPQRNWRTRRHRQYFQVRTIANEDFELYLDRGTKPGYETWVLVRRLPTEAP